jgi:hypothetical protein
MLPEKWFQVLSVNEPIRPVINRVECFLIIKLLWWLHPLLQFFSHSVECNLSNTQLCIKMNGVLFKESSQLSFYIRP